MDIGDKVRTKSHPHLALDYHGLQGVVGEKKKDTVFHGTKRVDATFCWVDFCGPEYEKRDADRRDARRLVKGLWITEEALTKEGTWADS